MNNKYVVIMAGGKGERFWPQSRLKHPKHLLPIVGDSPMIVQTLERLDGVVPPENIFIITNIEQQEAMRKVCSDLAPEQIVAEPMGRDTAAAVALAKSLVKSRDPDAIFAILPADHIIHNHQGFKETLNTAFKEAEKEFVLVTIGLEPTRPATGYGYIHKGDQLEGNTAFKVKEFVEKPDAETAKKYMDSGEYLWNAGMFVWRVSAIEDALQNFCPGIHAGLADFESHFSNDEDPTEVLKNIYPKLNKISIDYAVMEKAPNVVTIPASFDWDDVGEWTAIARHENADGNNNVVKGNVISEDSQNNIAISDKDHLIALVGVENLVVVHTPDATLVCPKNKVQEIKGLVKKLAEDPKYKQLI